MKFKKNTLHLKNSNVFSLHIAQQLTEQLV